MEPPLVIAIPKWAPEIQATNQKPAQRRRINRDSQAFSPVLDLFALMIPRRAELLVDDHQPVWPSWRS